MLADFSSVRNEFSLRGGARLYRAGDGAPPRTTPRLDEISTYQTEQIGSWHYCDQCW